MVQCTERHGVAILTGPKTASRNVTLKQRPPPSVLVECAGLAKRREAPEYGIRMREAMLHCSIPIVEGSHTDAAPSTPDFTRSPGFLTAKALQSVLGFAPLTTRQQEISDEHAQEEEAADSPYCPLPRPIRKKLPRYNSNGPGRSSVSSRVKYDSAIKRKRCKKLEPMPTTSRQGIQPKQGVLPVDNQSLSSIARGAASPDSNNPSERHAQLLRLGLRQTSVQQHAATDRLQSEIQWIHGHFPVLKLATSKCSRRLRQQLFRNAIMHVFVTATLRKAYRLWIRKVLDARRTERLRLSASRKLLAMSERVSLDRLADRFKRWQDWVLECQTQEALAAVITLQRFVRYSRARQQGRVIARKQMTLMTVSRLMVSHAVKIQRAYRRYRQAVTQYHRDAAARRIQQLQRRRQAHDSFVKRQNAAKRIEKRYRTHIQRRHHQQAAAIALLFERSRDRLARRIQSAWASFTLWRSDILPVEVVRSLVDQVEFLAAVRSIQRHLRGFQCRLRLKKKHKGAVCLQRCWRAAQLRRMARQERQLLHLHRKLAACCLQRTFKRLRHRRQAQAILQQSACPLYLRARHRSHSFRERFEVPISKSAVAIIQATWRRHVAYENKKKRRAAALILLQLLRKTAIHRKWRAVVLLEQQRRTAAARTLQRWIRSVSTGYTPATLSSTTTLGLVAQIPVLLTAAGRIQRWYRRRRYDSWSFVLQRILTEELPLCTQAANRLLRCWRAHSTRKREQDRRRSEVAELTEQQLRAQVVASAALRIQRLFRRVLNRRDGKLLLQKYKILLRQDLKRRQQRAIVHSFLQEKGQQRRTTAAGRCEDSAKTQGSTTEDCQSPASTASTQEEDTAEPEAIEAPVEYWSEEYQRAYLFDPRTGESTWI